MIALSVFVLGAACAAGVNVQIAAAGGIDLEAKAAPLSAVLECLTEQTGLKIINTSGVLPVRKITLSLRDKTEVQVIAEVLTEAGLNYALTMDPTGARVGMLLLMGLKSSTASNSAASPAGFQPYPTGAAADQDTASPPGSDFLREQLKVRGGANNQPLLGPQTWPVPLGPYVPPLSPELYPEPYPLSPQSLREARRVSSQTARPDRDKPRP